MSDFKIVQLLNPIQINVPINPTGVYNAATTYGIGDSVSYGNSSYICILASTGNVPTNTTYWQLLASSATNKLSTTARNQTGVTIPAETVVYFSGVSGNVPTLALSQANTELGSTKTIGITATSIANNANGEVVVFGLADNLNTSAFTAGSALWLSPSVPGGLTMTKPSAPNHMVFIGFCTRSHPTQGTIEVKIQNGFELEELHNVAIASLADNQVLKYDLPNLLWKNETLVKGDVGLGNVPNVDTTNPSNIVEDSTHRFVTDTEKTTWNGKENAITAGTTAQYWRGDKSFQTLDKTAVGLGSVDDTSDINKPISTATQNALNLITNVAWTGDYNNGVTYTVGQGVMFSGASFRMIIAIGAAGYNPVAYPANWLQVTDYVSPNDIGLGSVDNTSDLAKPVSTATQTALNLKVDKAGDTMTGILEIDVTLASTSPLIFIKNQSPNGIASLLTTNDMSNFLSFGVTGSTITGLPLPNDEAFLFSSNAINAATTLADGFKWYQDGTQVASIINAVFTADSIDASPVNFTGLTQATPTISDFVPFTDGSVNYKASLNEMPVSAPQNLNSIINALIFG